MDTVKDPLWELCQKFIEDKNIHCEETVYQADRVIEGAYDFIAEVCRIVGYAKLEDEDDDEG